MRKIFLSPNFEKSLVKFVKLHPELKRVLNKVLLLLKNDVNAISLQVHKLHGRLANSYGCKINYKYRLVFSYDDNLIYLESIGTHDEIY